MERRLVVPGELLTEKKVMLGPNVFVEGGKVYSKVVGLAEVEKYAKVIPLEGNYIPKQGDWIIGVISDVKIPGFDVWMRSPYTGFLPRDQISVLVEDGDFSVCIQKTVFEKIKRNERIDRFEVSVYKDFFGRVRATREELMEKYGTYDEFSAMVKIVKRGEPSFDGDFDHMSVVYSRVAHVDAVKNALLAEGIPLTKGELLYISPTKVPRVIGRNASMLNIIKKVTNGIAVGSNGIIWVKKGNIPLLKKILRKVEMEAHTKGLTNKIKRMVEG